MHAACAPPRTRPPIELADVVRNYGPAFEHGRVLPDSAIRPGALRQEVKQPVVRALRALRVATRARRDRFNPLPVAIAQEAIEIRREGFALLASRKMTTDLLK